MKAKRGSLGFPFLAQRKESWKALLSTMVFISFYYMRLFIFLPINGFLIQKP
jgi:hypothetical protein